MTTTIDTARAAAPDLSRGRLYAMRVGYLLMGVGLALVKWPNLPDVHALPLYEGVTWRLLLAQEAEEPRRWNRRLAARSRSLDAIPAL